MVDDRSLMMLRNRPASGFLQRRRIGRFDAEAHRAEPCAVQPIEQLDVEPIETRLRLERERQPARRDLIAQLDAAIALLGEQRIAEDDVRMAHAIRQPLDFIDDVRDRSRAVPRQDAVRAVRTEFRAAAAGEQRVSAADRARRPLDAEPAAAILRDQIPARERQRIEIVDLFAHDHPRRNLPGLRQTDRRRFRLAVEDEVAVVGEQLRHLRRRDAEEAHAHAARAHAVRPRRLVPVVDERRQHERHIGVRRVAGVARPDHLMAGAGENRRDVGHVHARHVVKLFLEIANNRRDARERIEARSVAADDGVFADEPAIGFQICENHSHQSPRVHESHLEQETSVRLAAVVLGEIWVSSRAC